MQTNIHINTLHIHPSVLLGAMSQPFASGGELAPTASQIPPRIGSVWPGQGGIYAGLVRGAAGQPDYHLIVATDPGGSIDEVEWGGRGEDLTTTGDDLDGLANTTALVKSDAVHPIAQWVSAIAIEGHQDWYIASRRESRLLWSNVPELFEAGWHWTSTQYSPLSAWFQDFDVGHQGYGVKVDRYRARAVRRFLST